MTKTKPMPLRISSLFISSLLAVVVGSAACKDDAAPSCAAVVAHTGKIAQMPMEGELQTRALEKCEKEFSAKQRACVLKATDIAQLQGCK